MPPKIIQERLKMIAKNITQEETSKIRNCKENCLQNGTQDLEKEFQNELPWQLGHFKAQMTPLWPPK